MASPLVEQFRKGGVSRDVRLTAASGALPLKPRDQVDLLLLLTRDSDGEVRSNAESNIMAVSGSDLAGVLSDSATSPRVLHFFGARLDTPSLLQAIVQNPTTEDKSIQEMVPRLSTELLEFVVINQTRLLRHPVIIETLMANRRLSLDQRRRLNELKHDFKIGIPAEPTAAPPPSETEILVNLNEGPPEDEAPPPISVEQALEQYSDEGEEAKLTEDEMQKRLTAYQKLVGMTPAEKMMEGLKGDRETRMILIRDRNRVVYAAVLTSPKLTVGDVEAFASLRTVSPEVLRHIGAKREWTRKYNVSHELVKNPLTPIEISMKLISRLSAMDLRRLSRDRNVPEQIRRQATKMVASNR